VRYGVYGPLDICPRVKIRYSYLGINAEMKAIPKKLGSNLSYLIRK